MHKDEYSSIWTILVAGRHIHFNLRHPRVFFATNDDNENLQYFYGQNERYRCPVFHCKYSTLPCN
jgi:hypothetical protein